MAPAMNIDAAEREESTKVDVHTWAPGSTTTFSLSRARDNAASKLEATAQVVVNLQPNWFESLVDWQFKRLAFGAMG